MTNGTPGLTEEAPRPSRHQFKLLTHIRCPHCWHSFRTSEIVWVAQHEELRGDPVLGPNQWLRFRPSRFDVHGNALDARGMPCYTLACPRCHLTIPPSFTVNEPLIISLIGAPASGKSYFLAAMTRELRRISAKRFCLVFDDADPSGNRILNDYVRTLFMGDPDERVNLPKTHLQGDLYAQVTLSNQDVRLPRPFVFSLRPGEGHPHAAEAEDLSRVLCVYDNAGEHFLPDKDSPLDPGTQHMARARVLMFLFDPTQDARMRELCLAVSQDPQLSAGGPGPVQEMLLTEAAQRVRRYAGLSPNRKIGKPLLILVAKADVWAPLIREDIHVEPFIDRPPGAGQPARVDFSRVEAVSTKVRRFLKHKAPEFVAVAESISDHVVYIPVSALGRSPEIQTAPAGPVPADGRPTLVIRRRDIVPHWVSVPVLYGFAKWSTSMVEGA